MKRQIYDPARKGVLLRKHLLLGEVSQQQIDFLHFTHFELSASRMSATSRQFIHNLALTYTKKVNVSLSTYLSTSQTISVTIFILS